MNVSFVWPSPKSSKVITSYTSSMASCSIPYSAGSTLFPFESEKYMEETIFSCRTISWYSPAFQPSWPSGALMQQRNFPPTRKSISQKDAVKPFGAPPLHHIFRVCPRLNQIRVRHQKLFVTTIQIGRAHV